MIVPHGSSREGFLYLACHSPWKTIYRRTLCVLCGKRQLRQQRQPRQKEERNCETDEHQRKYEMSE